MRLAILTSLAVLYAGGAQAAADISAAFGNTIEATYPSGRTAKLWLNRDGTFTSRGAKGAAGSGTWKVKGEELCLSAKGFPLSFCSPIPKVKVGSAWIGKSAKGEVLKQRLVAGR